MCILTAMTAARQLRWVGLLVRAGLGLRFGDSGWSFVPCCCTPILLVWFVPLRSGPAPVGLHCLKVVDSKRVMGKCNKFWLPSWHGHAFLYLHNACAFVSAKATFETIIEIQRLPEEVWFIFSPDPIPIIVYACQSLTNQLTEDLDENLMNRSLLTRTLNLTLMHMGQFMQGGKNGRLMSYFFRCASISWFQVVRKSVSNSPF